MNDIAIDNELRRSLISAWHRFQTQLDPLRPEFFAYCRRLTGNLWDAEDLVQDSLLAAFGGLSNTLYQIDSPRAYLLRIATHKWIDRVRRRALERGAPSDDEASVEDTSTRSLELRDAAAVLFVLPPRERAAIALKDTFDLTLEECAAVLDTTVGAVKSALSRGRARLADAPAIPAPAPQDRAAIDAFVERYNARDLDGVVALLAQTASIRMYGLEEEVGKEVIGRGDGWLHHNFVNPFDGSPSNARWQVAQSHGQWVVLVFGGLAATDVLTSVMRLFPSVETPDTIRRGLVYALCPDVVKAVADELGLVCQTGGYRFPFDVSGIS